MISNLLDQVPYFGYIIAALCVFFAYNKLSFFYYFLAISAYFLQIRLAAPLFVMYLAISAVLAIPAIRRLILTRPLITIAKSLKLLPKISETEKIALTSGNTWVDAELFSGRPNFKWIFSRNYPKLTKEEQDFLDNEVEEVCRLCSDYETQCNRDLTEKVWQFLREKKFFGMVIPKKFGGLEFSAYAHSCVIEKLASRSVPLAITAMVPNSLGPAELLLKYGTEEQQNKYLPRLADGRDLPCFALTEDSAGSDATSIISNGVIFRDADGSVKIRMNWQKRYITLGAYATLIGVAFQLRDPEKILFDQTDVGITCALIPNDTPGVRQGRRHDPLSTHFVNSPINGENVVVGLEAVIGGKDGLGKGWKMLMECLAAGRGISLPSTASGGSKLVVRAISAYSSIRKQFGTPIGKFEGVEEVLSRIISRTYSLDAMRRFTAGSIDSGDKPSVITAIAKYHATEIFRKNINDGMDIMGGRGIIRGPRNLLANAYFSTPISITVEGANIMTRSLMHFGQGAIMCHPYAYKEFIALEENDVKGFDAALFGHVNHVISNLVRSIILSVTRGYVYKPFSRDLITKYERKILWCSAVFALLADFAILRFGGNLKRKEKNNGRFGDVLSMMYLSVCTLKKFQENGSQKDEIPVVQKSLQEFLTKAQSAIDELYQNLFGCTAKIFLTPVILWSRLNIFVKSCDDKLDHKITENVLKNGKLRDELTSGIFINNHPNDNLGRLENAMKYHESSEYLIGKIKAAIKAKELPANKPESLVEMAYQKNILTLQEYHTLLDCFAAINDAMRVDEYTLEEYKTV